MRKHIAIVAAIAVALAGVVGTTVAFAAKHKTVTLSVDGEAEQIQTTAATVAEALAQEDIELDAHDAVAPSPDAKVDEGTRIAVRYGRRLDLSVDGEQNTYWVTATNVDAALDQIGREFSGADLMVSRSSPAGRTGRRVSRGAPVTRAGLDLLVKTEKTVTLVRRGKKSRKVTTALTVAGALDDLGVKHDRNDEIKPRSVATLEDGATLRVVRITKKRRTVKVAIPNETVVRYNDHLLEGRTKVRREGRDGLRLDTYKVVLADGKQRKRKRVRSKVRTRPVDRVVVHGTREPAPEPAPSPEPSPEPSAEPQASGGGGGISSAPCPSGSEVESGLTSNAIGVHRAVCHEYPQVDSYGGYRSGDGGAHGEGRALDVMVSDSSLGDSIANWVRANAGRLGVSEIIWAQRIWTAERSDEGWRYMEDRGSATANHYDHVHITVY